MAAIIDTGLLTRGLRSEFFQRFDGTPVHFKDLATRIESSTDRETYRWLGTAPRMREWGTGRMARGVRTESYSVENLKYEATVEVDRDEIADDQTGQIRLRISELAQRAATHKDYLIAQLLVAGESSGLSYDGQPFFSNAHESGASGAQSNIIGHNVDDPADVDVPQFKSAMKKAIAAMLAFKDDQGDPALISAGGLVAVVPPQIYLTALEAVNATVIGDTTNVLHGAARVISLPWLTDAARWYLLKTDTTIRPFIFQDREPVEFGALADDSDDGFKREKFLYGVRARYSVTYGYWQYAMRVLFT